MCVRRPSTGGGAVACRERGGGDCAQIRAVILQADARCACRVMLKPMLYKLSLFLPRQHAKWRRRDAITPRMSVSAAQYARAAREHNGEKASAAERYRDLLRRSFAPL